MKKLLLALIASLILVGAVSAGNAAFAGNIGGAASALMLQEQQSGHRDIDPKTYVVYITKTGKKYHLDGCQYLKKSKIKTTLAEARRNYDACKVCKPPK
ncbi:hypothetical protein KDL44_07380 [bacterium]|nr:hypothetical protein [bacterium]